jgi:hypothetical protein
MNLMNVTVGRIAAVVGAAVVLAGSEPTGMAAIDASTRAMSMPLVHHDSGRGESLTCQSNVGLVPMNAVSGPLRGGASSMIVPGTQQDSKFSPSSARR